MRHVASLLPGRIKHRLFTVLLLLAPASAAIAGDTQQQPVPVHVTTTSLQQVPALIEVVGTLQAAERATIAAKVTGMVTQVPVTLGSKVKAGDLLVALSAGEIKARLGQAEAQLAQARRNLARERSLLNKGASTAETVKTMVEAYAMAEAGYREAQTMLSYTRITAPFAGVITRKQVNSGDLATPGTPLLQIENNTNLQVHTAVPESLILSIKENETLNVRVPVAKVVVPGTVAEIAPAADPDSRTAPVTLALPPTPNLRTGQFARVLLPGKEEKALLVPDAAIVPYGQMDRVFVVDDKQQAQLRLVRTGMSYNGLTEILSGLDPEETVVISNNRLLHNGQPLRIQP